jgi:F0F1-type ATP synthase membrane subunit b/b'
LWKPYLRVRHERVNRIDGYRKEAARLEIDAATSLSRVEAQLGEARRQGSGERARARAEAQAAEQQLLATAQVAAQGILRAARARLDGTVESERTRLEAQVRTLAGQAATRILGRPVVG